MALPDRPVIYVGGDGGFSCSIPVFLDRDVFGIAVVAIVFNDHAYGNGRRIQREMFGGRLISSDLYNPDFAKFVDSFGMDYWKADSPETLAPALDAALATGKPAFIEVKIEGFPPVPTHVFPQGRG